MLLTLLYHVWFELIGEQVCIGFYFKHSLNRGVYRNEWLFSSHLPKNERIYIMHNLEILFYFLNFTADFFNPSKDEATFVQSTRTQRFLKNILNVSCGYSSDSSHRGLSNEYPCAIVSVIFQDFCIIFYRPN